ncbi:Protein GrpE [bioreactor metagenome]|uniref:Protein GrpE n=1 Tax=bioreactor metagenome TaxID=1076179 RepID=A0A645D600_9ZZZZ
MAKCTKEQNNEDCKKEQGVVDETAEKEENTANEVVKTKEEILSDQLADKNDQLLRLAAEYDNFRKRTIREKESIYSDVKSNVLGEFLPIIDNFERALNNRDAETEDYKKGIDMIFNQFLEIIKKHGVEAFGDKGDAFDPNVHNAVMHVEDDTLENNVVAEVFTKGYKVGDNVIRPAVVKVAN